MKIRKRFLIFLLAMIIIGVWVVRSQPPHEPLPDRAIVAIAYDPESKSRSLIFMNSDGSDPIKWNWEGYYPAFTVNWSPSGKSLAYHKSPSYQTTEGIPILITPEGQLILCPELKAGYGRLSFLSETSVTLTIESGSSSRVIEYDLLTCKEKGMIYQAQLGERVTGLFISSTGQKAVTIVKRLDDSYQAVLVYSQEGKLEKTITYAYNPAWSRNGEKLIYSLNRQYGDCSIGIADKTGTEIFVLESSGDSCGAHSFTWSPDDQEILYIKESKAIKLNLVSGKVSDFYNYAISIAYR